MLQSAACSSLSCVASRAFREVASANTIRIHDIGGAGGWVNVTCRFLDGRPVEGPPPRTSSERVRGAGAGYETRRVRGAGFEANALMHVLGSFCAVADTAADAT